MLFKRSDHRYQRRTGAQTNGGSGAPGRRTFSESGAVVARIAGVALILLPLLADSELAQAESANALAAASTSSKLNPVDYNFVAQANLGAPFQIDSGRLAEAKATTAAVRDYAHLMVITHIPVVDALNKILRRKDITAPPDTLLRGAYGAMIASLTAERGAALDRDYVQGQVDYQKGNAALFRDEIENGTDPDLREFARTTLPKIEDHLERAIRLANESTVGRAASE